MEENDVTRLILCLVAAFIGSVSVFVIWFAVGMALVWHSPDGQTGMGPALGALFIGGPLGGVLGYGFEYWRTGRQPNVAQAVEVDPASPE